MCQFTRLSPIVRRGEWAYGSDGKIVRVTQISKKKNIKDSDTSFGVYF